MSEIKTQWENLHKQARFRPLYPHEAVVRFLMTQFPRELEARKKLRVLDVGCGAGRHTVLFAEQGFQTIGVDVSVSGLEATQERIHARGLSAELLAASMHALPFGDAGLDGILSFGVLEYNDWKGMEHAVNEIYRTLAVGGKAQILTRTTRDYRYGKGDAVDERSFRLNTAETNEAGMVNCFLAREDVTFLFRNFSHVTVDSIELTTDEWRVDSDWIVTVTK